MVAADEACDDGNKVDDDECTNSCTAPICGDGLLQAINAEQCDEGPGNSNAGMCTLTCAGGIPFGYRSASRRAASVLST